MCREWQLSQWHRRHWPHIPPAMQMELLKALDGLGLLQESVEDTSLLEEVSSVFKKEKKKQSSKTIEERAGHYDDSKCQARVWRADAGRHEL